MRRARFVVRLAGKGKARELVRLPGLVCDCGSVTVLQGANPEFSILPALSIGKGRRMLTGVDVNGSQPAAGAEHARKLASTCDAGPELDPTSTNRWGTPPSEGQEGATSGQALRDKLKFDWYQATVLADTCDLGKVLEWAELQGDEIRECNGLARQYRYERGRALYRKGVGLFKVLDGPEHQGVHFITSGEAAHAFAGQLREACPCHSVTRADVALDIYQGGDYDRDRLRLRAIAERHRVSFQQVADDLNPRAGRTQYVGSPASSCRVRLYEKGLEQYQRVAMCMQGFKVGEGAQFVTDDGELFDPCGWVRLECQVRAERKDAREHLAQASPAAFWGCSPWLREVYGEFIGGQVDSCTIQLKRGMTDHEKAVRLMVRQWGKTIGRMFEDAKGDSGKVGGQLWSLLGEKERQRVSAFVRV